MQKFKFNYLSHKNLNRWSRACMATVIRTRSSSVSLFCHSQGQASFSCSNMAAPVPPAPFSLHSISRKKEFHTVFAFLSYEPELTHMAQLQRTLGGEYFSWVSCPGKKSIPLKKRSTYVGSLSSSLHASPWGRAGGL